MTVPAPEPLRLSTRLAYGAGDFGPAVTANILVFYLLFFLTDVAGLSAGWAGSVLMVGKIFDAINDPIVGVFSDRSSTPWGRRLPWILGGALPFALIFLAQWWIPPLAPWGLFLYYLAIGIVFNLFYTVVNLPYTALTPELTQDYNERTRLSSVRFIFSIGGSILSLILYILIASDLPERPKAQFWQLAEILALLAVSCLLWSSLTLRERGRRPFLAPAQRRILSWGLFVLGGALGVLILTGLSAWSGRKAWLFGEFLLMAIVLTWGYTLRDRQVEPHLVVPAPPQSGANLPFRQQLRIVFQNRAFLFVIGLYLCSWLAVQLTASILVYFVVSWMRLSEGESGLVALAVQGMALAMLLVWQRLGRRLDKKAIYMAGTAIWLVAQTGLWLLQPGQTGAMYALAILAGCGVSVAYLIPWSMIPDVVDLDELETGQRREGIFYAFMVLLQKIGLALGLFLVGLTLEWAGFIPRLPGKPIPIQPDGALLAIRFAVAPLPAFFLLLGLILVFFYPLTREVHGEIRAQLAQRRENV